MKRTIAASSVLALLVLSLAGAAIAAQAAPDERLFQEAKLLIFDKDWRAALNKLDELGDKYPDSPLTGQALFYRGECLNGLGGREREALRAFKDYTRFEGANPNLVEEAEGRIIDLAYALYEKGDRSVLEEVETRLKHPGKAVRYYAAYKLSLVPDKKIAAKAVPALERIIETERDPELRDRARIALLRVSPESLKAAEDRRPTRDSARMLRIRVWKKGQKSPVLSLNIPWALADLALQAIPDEEKAAIRKKGYDLNRIMNELAKSKESILRIEEDDSIIEIWIE
jgi:outer membrane protein assembly factor BamD (BamD/ComL family)